MGIILFSVLFFVIGFLIGGIFTCERLISGNKKIYFSKKTKPKKRSISKHFTDTGESFSDLMCEVTGEQTDTYIKQNRLKQNDAYTYVKNK